MTSVLHWRGPQVLARAKAAAVKGINETMADCVNDSKTNHPWKNQTGTAEGSIALKGAQEEAGRIVGRWGSFTVAYFIWLEIGTSRMSAMPTLRPAADANYPRLAGRIKAAF